MMADPRPSLAAELAKCDVWHFGVDAEDPQRSVLLGKNNVLFGVIRGTPGTGNSAEARAKALQEQLEVCPAALRLIQRILGEVRASLCHGCNLAEEIEAMIDGEFQP